MDVGWEEHDFLFGILDQDNVFVDPPFIWRADLNYTKKVAGLNHPSAVRHGQPNAKPPGWDRWCVCGT